MSVHVDQVPTVDSPEFGEITFCGVVISQVMHWQEDGDHVFRSTEFDVIAGAPDLYDAVAKFVESAEDYAKYLSELADSDQATLAEAEAALALFQRFAEGYRTAKDELMKKQRQLVQINLPRRRGRRGSARAGRYLRSPHAKSSQLSRV